MGHTTNDPEEECAESARVGRYGMAVMEGWNVVYDRLHG